MIIQANDTVLHKPTGETWVVCGVSKDYLIPCGYPFPSRADVADCVLIEKRREPQTQEMKNALIQAGCTSYLEKTPC